MTMSAAVVTILDLVFLALFAVAARDFWRRRDVVRLAVLVVFGCLALVLVGGLVGRMVPAARTVVGVATSFALIGEPIAALWLVSQFWQPARRFITSALVSGAVIALFVVYSAIFGLASLAPIMGGISILMVAYFGVFEVVPAIGLAIESRRRAGSSRLRMSIGALATLALGVALVVLLVAGAMPSVQGSGLELIVEVLALCAAVGYLVAFAPPRFVRRLSQQSIAYHFMRDLNTIPDGAGSTPIWELLAATAVRSTGATRVAVIIGREVVATASSPGSWRSTLRLDIDLPGLATPAPTRLELLFRGHPLFVEDDEELLRMLAERAWRSVERDDAIGERDRLIEELRAAGSVASL